MSRSDTNNEKQLLDRAEEILTNAYNANEAFNKFVDGEEPISFNSPKDHLVEYRFEKSRILYWLDREAYDNERQQWASDSKIGEHQEAIDLLKGTQQLEHFNEIVDAIKRKRIAPFVGAGLSAPCQKPLWGEALQKLQQKIPDVNAAEFEAAMQGRDYLKAAQILYDHSPEICNNFIRTTFDIRNPVVGPVTRLPKICSGCIITTNFDNAIEKTFEDDHQPLDGYMHGTQQNKFAAKLIKGDRCILKLHGNVEDSKTYIFTQKQYDEAYGGGSCDFGKPLPRALRQIFVSHSLLFLGCSLEHDRILELFQTVVQANDYDIPNHYALLPVPKLAQEKREKEERLLKLKIHPIWYPMKQHEFVEKILRLAADMSKGLVPAID